MIQKYFLILLFAYLAYGQQNPALKGWLLGWETDPNLPLLKHGNKSYYMGVNYKANFLQAMQFCDIVYMKLVTIESEEENNFIQKIIAESNHGNDYWSSGSKILDSKNWVWMSTGKDIKYTKWASNEPSNSHEKCLQLKNSEKGLTWNDLPCNNRINFICQRDNFDQTEVSINKDISSVSPNINLLQTNGKSYYFSRDFNGNFLQAAFFCRTIHMTLVTINSAEENLAIQKYIRDTNLGGKWWTAGSRILDGTWTWFTNGQHINYTNWEKGQPNNNNDKCLQLKFGREQGLLWNDINCNEQMPFICERYNAVVNPRIQKREVQKDDKWMQPVKETPSGLISYSYNSGKKFHIQTNLRGSQYQGALYCDYHGLQLVTIENKEKNDILERVLADVGDDGPFWTSGKKPYNEWIWGNNKPLSYLNWSPNKLSVATNCLEILSTGEWKPVNCLSIRPIICEPKDKYIPGFEPTLSNPEPIIPNLEPTSPMPEIQKPSKKCSIKPVVNVYINNNLVTEEARSVPALERHYMEGEYTVDVTNKITPCTEN